MSVHVMSWVLRYSDAMLGKRLVLLVLADHAREDGTGAWPSVGTIAREARMSERAVQYALRELERDGEIVKAGQSPSGTSIYDVQMGGAESAPLASVGVQSTTGGGEVVAPEPSKEPSRSSGTTPNGEVPLSRDGEIEVVWKAYTDLFGSRLVLTPQRRDIIKRALKARDANTCCAAILGLSRSSYHSEHGFTDIRYALRGGGHAPNIDGVIDRMAAIGTGALQAGESDRATTLAKEHYDHARRLEAAGR